MAKRKQKELKPAEENIIKDMFTSQEEIQEVLIERGYYSTDFFEYIKKIEDRMKNFPFYEKDIKVITDLRDEFVSYSVYVSLQHSNKNTIRTILKEVNSNIWIDTKTRIERLSDGSELIKTDSYVNQETNIKMQYLLRVEAFVLDLDTRLKNISDSLRNISILLNSKIKHYSEEEMSIATFWVGSVATVLDN